MREESEECNRFSRGSWLIYERIKIEITDEDNNAIRKIKDVRRVLGKSWNCFYRLNVKRYFI